MVPREAGRGGSFKGAGAYYLHDKNASTSERVEFTHCENVPTQDPEKALKWMAWTAIHADELKRESGAKATGRSCEKPVFTFSLSWHPEQDPHKWEMIGAGRRALIALGLEKHETVMVAHNDCDHPHLHLIVNVIDPETGKANRVSFSKKKLSKWAEEYEREHGKIYCNKRVENNAKRDQGEKIKYEEPGIDLKSQITKLYQQSDSGAAFHAALETHGFKLAKGKKIVLVDPQGNVHSLARQIEGVKEKDVRAKLGDLKLADLDEVKQQLSSSKREQPQKSKDERQPETNKPSTKAQAHPEQEYVDRDQQDREWQESIIDAAIAASEPRKPKSKAELPPAQVPSHLLNNLQDRHLAELGQLYQLKHHARLSLDARLEHQYGAQERGLRQGADRLEQTLKNSGRVRLWWLKATRQISATAVQDLKEMRLTLDNIGWRKQEAQQAVEAESFRRQAEMEIRHKRERLELQPKTLEILSPLDQLPDDHAIDPDADENYGPSLDY